MPGERCGADQSRPVHGSPLLAIWDRGLVPPSKKFAACCQALRRRLPGSVALVLYPGAIGCPVACTRCPRRDRGSGRAQTAWSSAIAQRGTCLADHRRATCGAIDEAAARGLRIHSEGGGGRVPDQSQPPTTVHGRMLAAGRSAFLRRDAQVAQSTAWSQAMPLAPSEGGRIRSASMPMKVLARSIARHSGAVIFRISSDELGRAIQALLSWY